MKTYSIDELKKDMSPESLARARVSADDMIKEMVLSEIRALNGLTQAELAKKLGVKPPSLSQMESQKDMQISTLKKLIEALGGKLELIASMPGCDIKISQFVS